MEPAHLTYRPFLDGLRAFAVLAVIAYHVECPGTRGGFLGVDVFFVLSGYLITQLLVAEQARDERIDFLGFYARRARRLLPALFVVIAVVTLAGDRLYDPQARHLISRDALASVLYVANWSFVVHGQSYFELFTDPSPLRHMWSLAVEEQFYLGWPMLVALLPLRRRGGLVILGALVAASAIALAVLYDPEDPSRAYYGTDARLHEPVIGAIAALLWLRHRERLAALRHLAVPCLAAMLAFVVLLDDEAAAYYRGLSLTFCVITAVLVLALEAGAPRTRALLGSLPAVWIGKLSYGMYLWHWPIAIALGRTQLHGATRGLAVVGLTIAIAALSYHLIERPIRTARTSSRRAVAIAMLAVGLAAGGLALRMRASHPPTWAGGAMTITGTGEYKVALIGDSIVRSTANAWADVALARGWTLIDGSMGGCSVASGFQLDSHGRRFSFSRKCVRENPRILGETAAQEPDLVIWQSHSEVNGILDPGTNLPAMAQSPEHDRLVLAGWETAWQRFPNAEFVLVELVPPNERVEDRCADDPSMCADDGSSGLYPHLNQLLQQFASTHPRTRFATIAQVVCPDGPPCPRELDGLTVRHDGYHYTPEFAPRVVSALVAQLPGSAP